MARVSRQRRRIVRRPSRRCSVVCTPDDFGRPPLNNPTLLCLEAEPCVLVFTHRKETPGSAAGNTFTQPLCELNDKKSEVWKMNDVLASQHFPSSLLELSSTSNTRSKSTRDRFNQKDSQSTHASHAHAPPRISRCF